MENVTSYVSDEPLQQCDSLPESRKARDWAESEEDPWNRLILSLDGGGIRGYSSLLILHRLMEEISVQERAMMEENENADDFTPAKLLPCHYFDYMYGTSTGGLIATMLGRLRMSVPECLRLYRELGDKLFGHKRLIGYLGGTKYPSEPLEKGVIEVVRDFCKEHRTDIGRKSTPGCTGEDPFWWTRLGDPSSDNSINVDWHICQAICITLRETPGTNGKTNAQTFLLRTYLHEYRPSLPPDITRYEFDVDTKDIKIWQVARATTAAPTYFKLLMVEEGGKISRYKDGGMGIANPSAVAYTEFRSRHGHHKRPALLLSLGTGLSPPGTVSTGFGKRRTNPFWNAILMGLSELKALLLHMRHKYIDCEGVHKTMLIKVETQALWYKRLNIPFKLGIMATDEWQRGDFVEYETGRQVKGATGGKTLQKMTDYANAYFESLENDFESYAPPLTKIKDCAEKLVRFRRARARDVRYRRDHHNGPQLEKRWDTHRGRYLAYRMQGGNLQKGDVDRPLTIPDENDSSDAEADLDGLGSDKFDAGSQSTTYSNPVVVPAMVQSSWSSMSTGH